MPKNWCLANTGALTVLVIIFVQNHIIHGIGDQISEFIHLFIKIWCVSLFSSFTPPFSLNLVEEKRNWSRVVDFQVTGLRRGSGIHDGYDTRVHLHERKKRGKNTLPFSAITPPPPKKKEAELIFHYLVYKSLLILNSDVNIQFWSFRLFLFKTVYPTSLVCPRIY